jgi:hypothetical protein
VDDLVLEEKGLEGGGGGAEEEQQQPEGGQWWARRGRRFEKAFQHQSTPTKRVPVEYDVGVWGKRKRWAWVLSGLWLS